VIAGARFGTLAEIVVATHCVSAMLIFAPHPCREQACCSACNGFVGSFRSGNRNKRIGISIDAPLKKRH